MKPKHITQTSIQEPEERAVDKDVPIEPGQSNSRSAGEDKRSNKRESRDEDSEQSKRQKKDEDDSQSDEEKQVCSCSPKNVMRCIGILPSLPIVDKFKDSSDSDESNDDLEGRITLKVGRNK